ncbi:MAG: NDP-sugar synthase [Chloroflexi bacterium]|nr:NDP-sugar synthase [Chloroflexota bacterium]
MIDHAIIMAARPNDELSALSTSRPKAMFPIMGMPTIGRVMDGYYKAGIRRFTVVVGEGEGGVIEWLFHQWHNDVQLSFASVGHQLGTAATLYATRDQIDGPVIVAPCDILVPETHVRELAEYFDSHPADMAAVSVSQVDLGEAVPSASVILDPRGHVMYASEVPIEAHQGNVSTLPIYALRENVVEFLDRVPVDERSGQRFAVKAVQAMIDEGAPVGTIEAEWALRIDTPQDLMDANLLCLTDIDTPQILSELPHSVEIIPPVHIDQNVRVGENVVLGPNVYLETESAIEANCVLENTIVLGKRIAQGKTIRDQIVSKDLIK